MRIHKIRRPREARWALPLFLLTLSAVSAPPGVAELREPEGKQDKESASEPDLKKGEYLEKTPFGTVKRRPANVATDKFAGTRNIEVEENGDVITFRRATPFGKQTWKRKRSELSAFDKRVLEARYAEKAAEAPATSAPLNKSARPAAKDKKSNR